jgi:hypothetical protein
MMQRIPGLRILSLVLLLTLVFVACGAPPSTTTSTPSVGAAALRVTATPAPVLADMHAPDDLKGQFNQDAGMPRIILLVSPT